MVQWGSLDATRTVTEGHGTCLPVDYGVMLANPRKAENDVVMSERGDIEFEHLSVLAQGERELDDMCDRAGTKGGPVNGLHWDR